MRLPPEIRSGDLVRTECKLFNTGPWRESDRVRQVWRGEEVDRNEADKEKRYFSYDMCYGDVAENVTELYRFVVTDACYKLIWHRPPRGEVSKESFMERFKNVVF